MCRESDSQHAFVRHVCNQKYIGNRQMYSQTPQEVGTDSPDMLLVLRDHGRQEFGVMC